MQQYPLGKSSFIELLGSLLLSPWLLLDSMATFFTTRKLSDFSNIHEE
jgi:hypothetical protein